MEELWGRYSRQMLFHPIGKEGQEHLLNGKVLIVGMGALGTVVANHLARAGVGNLVFCDRDYVEMSNLQRQTLFDEDDVARFLPKAVAAEQKLRKLNSSINIEGHVTDITSENVEEFMNGVDVIIDGTDNFQTRYLLNDVAYKYEVPFIYGGAVSSRGMEAVFIPGKTSCLRCLFPTHDSTGQTCDTIGVLSPVVDIVASLEALACLKLLSGNEDEISPELSTFDVWNNHHFSMKLGKAHEACPTCQLKEFPSLTQSTQNDVTTLCGRDTVQIVGPNEFDLVVWESKLNPIVRAVKRTPFLLRVYLHEGEKIVMFPDGRTLIQGTEDVSRAKSLFSKYIGM
ncbi:thiamine biosynthesis protein ThiF [Salipaludibacillus keqinensis]|uniref:Thiamine biosynthesis protein ThiF n=1 Tax=Salipaludibacillus keqinensis TaxID=2045207 RepID=A0A323TGP1_9BACI|nr:ThiF family adenylyltransferase [Salipaludibacillus keqinensis]PYZ94302.1 thiamine biosynthesis protein ThiF [Salipaludibacillus keqinensis]